jgi:hypothetical protein
MLEDLELSPFASLVAAMGKVSGALERRMAQDRRLTEAIRVVPIPSQSATVAGGSALISSASNILGPNTGYAWAVQSLAVFGLASADTANLFVGPAGPASTTPGNFRQSFTAASPSWQPGRTGCILNAGDTLILAGTGLSATQLTLTGLVVIMESWMMTEFLL